MSKMCVPYVSGHCRFGSWCRNEHVDPATLRHTVQGVKDVHKVYVRTSRNIGRGATRAGFDIGGVLDCNWGEVLPDQDRVLKNWVRTHGSENVFVVSKLHASKREAALLLLQRYEEQVGTWLDLNNVIFCDEIYEKASIAKGLGLDMFVDDRGDVLEEVSKVEGLTTVVCFDNVDDHRHRSKQTAILKRLRAARRVQFIWTTRRTGWSSLGKILEDAIAPAHIPEPQAPSPSKKRKLSVCSLCEVSFGKLTECIFCSSLVCKQHAFWCTRKPCTWKVCAECQKAETKKLIRRGSLWLCPSHRRSR